MNLDADFNVGDLVTVVTKKPNLPHFCYTDLALLMSSSAIGDTVVYSGDIGLVVEKPSVWGEKPGIIYGVLFGDKKKYLNFVRLELLRAGNESRQSGEG